MTTLFHRNMQRRIRFFLAVILILFSTLDCSAKDCKKKQAKALRLFRMSQEQAGKNKSARVLFLRKALKILNECEFFDNTQKVKVLLSLGQLEYGNGKRENGAALFERAVSLERMAEFPNSFTFVAIGDAFSGAANPTPEQLEKAASSYEEALEVNRFSSETLKEKTMSRLKSINKPN